MRSVPLFPCCPVEILVALDYRLEYLELLSIFLIDPSWNLDVFSGNNVAQQSIKLIFTYTLLVNLSHKDQPQK